MIRHPSGLLRLVFLLCAGVMMGALAWRFFAIPESVAYLYNSDAAYLPYLYADLFERGGRLQDWYLTPAPYYFPDWIVFFAIRYLAGTDHLAIFGFALMQGWCLLGLIRYLGSRYQADGWACSTAALSATALTCLPIDERSPFVYIHLSGHHFSTWLLGVLALDTVIRWRQRESIPVLDLAVLALLLALLVASDGIALLWMLLPAIAWMLSGVAAPSLAGPWRRQIEGRLTVALLAGWVFGSLIYKLVTAHPKKYGPKIGLYQVADNLQTLWTLMAEAVVLPTAWPLLAVLVLALWGALVAFAAAIKAKQRLPVAFPLVMMPLLAVLLSSALLSNIGVALRYLCPLYFGALLLMVLNPLGRAGTLCSIVVSCGVILAAVLAWPAADRAAPVTNYYPPEVACIDRELASTGAKRGLAQYWDAKRLSVLSRHRDLDIAQSTHDLHFYGWITTERLRHDEYDFAVVSKGAERQYTLDIHSLIAQSGAPLKVIDCGASVLYLYPNGGLTAPWSEGRMH